MDEIRPFYTSIYVDELKGSTLLNANIQEVYKKESNGVSLSNCGGWQSEARREHSIDWWMQPTIESIIQRLEPIYQEMGFSHKPVLGNYWFNINKRWNYNHRHHHPHANFSAALYIKVPKESGNITFVRPDMLTAWYTVDRDTERNWGSFWLESKEDILVIFPSYLEHYVSQNRTPDEDDARVSIAFNFK